MKISDSENILALIRSLLLEHLSRIFAQDGLSVVDLRLVLQVIRLARKDKPRTITEKCIETILAIKLEMQYSKNEILALYATHAPFGGNVIGLETAGWRYFGKSPDLLTWSEAATLAVLPNASVSDSSR